MTETNFTKQIKNAVDAEIEKASAFLKADNLDKAFYHLERAHILGQAVTVEHTRVHWLMLKIGLKKKDFREIFGQLFRIIGASTKTPFGIYPTGNTGGADVSSFKPMPIPDDLKIILRQAKGN